MESSVTLNGSIDRHAEQLLYGPRKFAIYPVSMGHPLSYPVCYANADTKKDAMDKASRAFGYRLGDACAVELT
jgi:hypothetical protein